MNLSKENIVSYLLNKTARCGLSDMSLRDVAIDDFMHDSDWVYLALLVYRLALCQNPAVLPNFPHQSPLTIQYVKQSYIIINLIIMY